MFVALERRISDISISPAGGEPTVKECVTKISSDSLKDPTGSDTPCRGKRHHRREARSLSEGRLRRELASESSSQTNMPATRSYPIRIAPTVEALT